MLIPFLLLLFLTPIAGAQQINHRHHATDTESTTNTHTIESSYRTEWKEAKAAARRQRLYGALSIALFVIGVYLTIANIFAIRSIESETLPAPYIRNFSLRSVIYAVITTLLYYLLQHHTEMIFKITFSIYCINIVLFILLVNTTTVNGSLSSLSLPIFLSSLSLTIVLAPHMVFFCQCGCLATTKALFVVGAIFLSIADMLLPNTEGEEHALADKSEGTAKG